ncbi:MAG: hypothetical protein ACNA7J_14760 [Wenzhouxiangella sp.]
MTGWISRIISSTILAMFLVAGWGGVAADQVEPDKLEELVAELEALDRSIERIETTEDGTLIVERRYEVTGSRIKRTHVQELDSQDLKALDYALEDVLLSLPFQVRSYTRAELERHGHNDLARALADRDPRIQRGR